MRWKHYPRPFDMIPPQHDRESNKKASNPLTTHPPNLQLGHIHTKHILLKENTPVKLFGRSVFALTALE